jgi:prepilin-type N-terminal cleavage/methylation domain-containing protein
MKLHPAAGARSSAFTLIEIMVVIVLMAVISAIGYPAMIQAMKKEGMRKAVDAVMEGCAHARAQAILSGTMAELVIRPVDRSLTVRGGTGSATAPVPMAGEEGGGPDNGAGSVFTATLPEDVLIELLGVNFVEMQEAEEAKVRFYPNGTSDEFTIILHGDYNEWRKVSLDVVTALAETESDPRKWQR